MGCQVLKLAQKRSMDLFFVTARLGDPHSKQYVLQQLKTLNIEAPKQLFMQSKSDTDTSLYKLNARKRIQKTHKIVLNCGDQLSDHVSGLSAQQEAMLQARINPSTYYFLHIHEDPARLSLKFVET